MKKPTLKKRAVSRKAEVPAVAIHAEDKDGIHHVVGLSNIRVVIVPDEGAWFAQGLDIDYAAQGETIPGVQEHFERGLRLTIDQHLQLYGNIKRLLKLAAPEICQNLLIDSSAQFKKYSQVSAHEVHEALHYNCIKYLLEHDEETECVV